MKTQEVMDVIVNHVIPNFDEESLFGSYVVDALNMAVNAVGAIDQIRWERDMAIEQLKDLGYEFGEKVRTDADAVSRQDAIDAIRKSAEKYTGFMEMEMYTDDDAVEAIDDLPSVQPEQRWISCQECLPKEWGTYLVTKEEIGWNSEACKTIDIAYFGTDWHKADKVLAWMPLPEPYGGEFDG